MGGCAGAALGCAGMMRYSREDESALEEEEGRSGTKGGRMMMKEELIIDFIDFLRGHPLGAGHSGLTGGLPRARAAREHAHGPTSDGPGRSTTAQIAN